MAEGDTFKPFQLGRCNVLLPLGEGGMAEVFLAEQAGAAGFARLVCIKRIRTNHTMDPEYVRMFVDEARLLSNITHPNVVQVLDLQEEGHDMFMVLEYVHGGDVRHLLKALNAASAQMTVAVACFVAWSFLRGLVVAHEARDPSGRSLDLVHRDISPGNILLGRTGAVKLSDFGVAKAAGRLAQTTDGSVKGSLAYMAPEMLEHARCDQRADLFASGVVLWEMLTCRRLFPGNAPAKLVHAILNKEIPPPSSLNPDVTAELDRVVARALARNPEERFQTARALETALYPFIRDHHPDDLENGLAALVRTHVTGRTLEDIAQLPRPARTDAPPAAAPQPAPPTAADVRAQLGVDGPPPLASSVDDFLAHSGALGGLEMPPLPVPAPPADDFFLAPPPVDAFGVRGAAPAPPAAPDGDDFFNPAAPLSAPPPARSPGTDDKTPRPRPAPPRPLPPLLSPSQLDDTLSGLRPSLRAPPPTPPPDDFFAPAAPAPAAPPPPPPTPAVAPPAPSPSVRAWTVAPSAGPAATQPPPAATPATTLPPPPPAFGRTSAPPPAATPSVLLVDAAPGHADGWQCTPRELYAALVALPGPERPVKLRVEGQPVRSSRELGVALVLDNLYFRPLPPTPPPPSPALEAAGLRQALTRLQSARATGLFLVRGAGRDAALFFQAGSLHYVHAPALGTPLCTAVAGGVETPAFTQLLEGVFARGMTAVQAAHAELGLDVTTLAGRVHAWLQARARQAFSWLPCTVAFVPNVTVPFMLPPAAVQPGALVP